MPTGVPSALRPAQWAWLNWCREKQAFKALVKPIVSTVWLTASFTSSAVTVGRRAMRRASSSVSSASRSAGKILLTMPSWCASSAVIESPVSNSSFVFRGPNSHGWAKYSTPHMPRRVPTTSANVVPSAATIRSHAHISISPAAYTGPCTWATVILRRLRQRRVFSKK